MQPIRPSMGSWLTYGLGTENQNLPGFVVLCPGKPVVGPQLWSNSFLPGIYQGTHINNTSIDPQTIIRDVNNQLPVARGAAGTARPAAAAEPAAPAEARARRAARGPHRVAGDGLPHAGRGPGRVRPRPRDRPPRARSTATASSPTPACSPAGWSSAACASCRSTTATTSRGTTTTTSQLHRDHAQKSDRPIAALLTRPEDRAACSTTRSCSGAASSAARRPPKAPRAATTTALGFTHVAGRRRREGRPGLRRHRRVRLRTPSRTASTSTTCTPRSCT